MKTLSIDHLSVILNIELSTLFVKVSKINKKYKLGIKDYYNLERIQYDVIRSLMDDDYLVNLIHGGPVDRKYNYTRSALYIDLLNCLEDYCLDEYSTADVKAGLPEELSKCGPQTVAAALRSLGYESRMVKLDGGKQGRRWFRLLPTASFM